MGVWWAKSRALPTSHDTLCSTLWYEWEWKEKAKIPHKNLLLLFLCLICGSSLRIEYATNGIDISKKKTRDELEYSKKKCSIQVISRTERKREFSCASTAFFRNFSVKNASISTTPIFQSLEEKDNSPSINLSKKTHLRKKATSVHSDCRF